MAKLLSSTDTQCGCGTCNTWARIGRYSCGCTTVEIFNDRNRCGQCTDFSGKRRYCDKSGHPRGH